MTIPVASKPIRLTLVLAWVTFAPLPSARAETMDPFDLLGGADAVTGELTANDAGRRRDALDRLLAQPTPVPIAVLQKLLTDPDVDVRARATLLAGRRQFVSLLPTLVGRLTDPEAKLRAAAAQALACFSPEQLARSREAAPALERATADSEGDVRLAALEALLKLPRERLLASLDAVARAIEDERVAIRLAATEGAGQLRHRQLLVPLLGRLNDPAREVRSAALEALGQINDPRVAPALMRQASEGPDEVRSQALLALGQLGAPSAVPFLRQILMEGPDKLRGRAAQALGLAGRTQAALAPGIARDLVALWTRDELRATLAEALLTLGEPAAPALAELLPRPALLDVEGVVRLLGAIPQAGNVKPLLDELQRRRARPELVIAALGRHLALAEPRVAPALLGLLGSDDKITRTAAMTALAGKLDARAQSVLVGLLDSDRDDELQRFAARELGRLALPGTATSLERLLGRGANEVVADAARALGRIGNEATAHKLEPLLGHASAKVRFAAAESLATIAAPALVPALCRRLKASQVAQKDELLPSILLALEGTVRNRPDDVARELLLGIAEQQSAALADRALAALAAMHDPQSARRLLTLVHRRALPDSTRAAAARALYGAPTGTRPLTELVLSDDSATLRAEAAWALRGTKDGAALAALKLTAEHAADPSVQGNARAALAFTATERPHFVSVRIEDVDRTVRADTRYRLEYKGGLVRFGKTDATGTVRDEGTPDGPFQLVVLD